MNTSIIYGPPGTGKTTRMMAILEDTLSSGIRPEEIAFVTFTRKGEEEGLSRAMDKFGLGRDSLPYFKTLHALAYAGVKADHNKLMQKKHYKLFSQKTGLYITGYYSEELQGGDDKYLFWYDLNRNNPVAARKVYEELNSNRAMFVAKQYELFKKAMDLVDYTDLIQLYVDKKIVCPVKVALIDEAQDLTTLQWKMIWTAFSGCEQVYVAGDDHQALFSWSGADVDYFLKLKGTQEILKKSYRLPQTLVDYAKTVTKQISVGVEKAYYGEDREGSITYVNGLNDIRLREGESYYCLTRNNLFIKQYEDWLRHVAVVPYMIKNEPYVTESEILAIKMFEKARATKMLSSTDEIKMSKHLVAVWDLINPWYDNFNWDTDKITFIRQMIARGTWQDTPIINVSTVHAVKGGEADNVIIMTDITKAVDDNYSKDPDSEHRVFYVGVTRAKNTVTVVLPQTKKAYPGLTIGGVNDKRRRSS